MDFRVVAKNPHKLLKYKQFFCFHLEIGWRKLGLWEVYRCCANFHFLFTVTQDLSNPIVLSIFSLSNFSGCLMFSIKVSSGTFS